MFEAVSCVVATNQAEAGRRKTAAKAKAKMAKAKVKAKACLYAGGRGRGGQLVMDQFSGQ